MNLQVKAGKLKDRVTIQSVSKSRTGAGGYTETFTDVVTVWAELQPLTAREIVNGNQITQEATHRVRMRYYPGITSSYRFVFGTRYFNIVQQINANERGVVLEFLVKENLNT